MTIFQIVISILAALILLVYSIALFQVWRLTGRRIKRERTRFDRQRARVAKELDDATRLWGAK